ncbi:MAG: DUF4962 domain-containing protein, partial [Terrimicrobiaceae bacterium]
MIKISLCLLRSFGFSMTMIFLGLSSCVCKGNPNAENRAILTFPPQGAKTYSPAPSLRWNRVEGAEDYRVQVAKDAAFSVDVLDDRTPITRFVAPKGLAPGKYFWRVAAIKGKQTGEFSEVLTFTVLEHGKIFSVPADADLATMQGIVAKAAAESPAKVVFAAGAEYRVAPAGHLFELSKVSDLEIDGNGASFVITNPTAGFIQLNQCDRV